MLGDGNSFAYLSIYKMSHNSDDTSFGDSEAISHIIQSLQRNVL